MKALLVTLIALFALPAVADSRPVHYAADRASLDLIQATRHLDAATLHLHRDLRAATGRSGLTAESRALAEATNDLRRRAERGARPARVYDAWREVEYRHQALEQRIVHVTRRDGRRLWVRDSLRDTRQAMRRTGISLERYRYAYWEPVRRHPRLGAAVIFTP